jgi:hypothetical protein
VKLETAKSISQFGDSITDLVRELVFPTPGNHEANMRGLFTRMATKKAAMAMALDLEEYDDYDRNKMFSNDAHAHQSHSVSDDHIG